MLEMIIAIAVITISTLASTTLVVTTIRTGGISQARIAAGNLAREGVEIVRGIRDSNWLKADQNVVDQSTGTTVDWRAGLPTATPASYVARFISGTNAWVLCSTVTCTNATIYCIAPSGKTCDTATAGTAYLGQIQTCPAGKSCTSTGYTRTITITPSSETVLSSSVPYLLVTSTVNGPKLTRPIVASERLYNWK